MNKYNMILRITSEILDRYRNSIPRKAFIQSMEQVNELVLGPAERLPQAVNPGLQLIRASELEADQISQLISGACPPFSLDHSDFVCQEHDCQECWKAWLGGRMTRRRVVFVRKDGRRYITEEFNGDKSEYDARGDCLDSCDLDWPEIRALFIAADTYPKFIKANLKAQAAYHSFLTGEGTSGVVRNLRKGREVPPADSVLFIYERPTADGVRFKEQEMMGT